MKPLSPDRKKEIRHNLIAAAALEALYALLFFLFREQVSSYGYFQAAATLLFLWNHRLCCFCSMRRRDVPAVRYHPGL